MKIDTDTTIGPDLKIIYKFRILKIYFIILNFSAWNRIIGLSKNNNPSLPIGLFYLKINEIEEFNFRIFNILILKSTTLETI
jgi:hypothetical protein